MPSKNPPEWSQTPGDTTFVIALIDRTRFRAPVLMHAESRFESYRTRSTARAVKFATAKRAANHLKVLTIEPTYLPVVLDVPKPQPRRRRPKPIHRWIPLPFGDERPAPAIVSGSKEKGVESGDMNQIELSPHSPLSTLHHETPPTPHSLAHSDEPDPTPEQLADQERQAREAPVPETVNEQILGYMRDYAANARGKLLRHYCKIRAEVYEAHLKGETPKPTKEAPRKKPQKSFDVFLSDGENDLQFVGQIKARNLAAAAAGAPEAFKAQEIDTTKLAIFPTPKEPKPASKPPLKSFDIFAWNPTGPKEFIGTIEAPGRLSKEALKGVAMNKFPAQLAGHAHMEITVIPTPRTTAEREKTYAPKSAKPLPGVWLVIPQGQETPAYAVRGATEAEARKAARKRAPGSKFTLAPDDGRATSLELWITDPGKLEPKS